HRPSLELDRIPAPCPITLIIHNSILASKLRSLHYSQGDSICQLRYPSEGRTYYDRKTGEGKTSKEALRALKRRISDRVYRHLIADANKTASV
ncbi:MAG: hypothetical protein GY926_23245, partial [bacterium]|nr:hypothetical protein [bacterium]